MAKPLRSVVVSAPGKLILSGEHSVVFGKPALAAALDLRTEVAVTPGEAGKVSITLPDLKLESSWDVADIQAVVDAHGSVEPPEGFQFDEIRRLAGVGADEKDTRALAPVAFLHMFIELACRPSLCTPSCAVTVRSKLPVGAGLGSSAAFSVALAGALLEATGTVTRADGGGFSPEHLRLINQWAFAGEKVIHGTPSGIDNSVSAYGGALHFVKGEEPVQLAAVPRLRILLVNTRVPRSTMALVAGVRERAAAFPTVMTPLLDAMGELSLEFERLLGVLAAEEGQGGWTDDTVSSLETLVDVNQHMLNAIGVGHASLNEVCAAAATLGAHAKLTGAGGGGCAFVLLRKGSTDADRAELKAAIGARGYEVFETTVVSQGVRGEPAAALS